MGFSPFSTAPVKYQFLENGNVVSDKTVVSTIIAAKNLITEVLQLERISNDTFMYRLQIAEDWSNVLKVGTDGVMYQEQVLIAQMKVMNVSVIDVEDEGVLTNVDVLSTMKLLDNVSSSVEWNVTIEKSY